jgi:ketosteroid isomerase-like protein
MIRFIITNTKVRVFGNRIAIVVCLENIETSVNGQVTEIGVIATNVFERNELNQWLLIHHHGSSVTNYIPPNHQTPLLNNNLPQNILKTTSPK